MKNFNEMIEKNMKKLELYVPVVERVHGGTHPEFYEVRKEFDSINGKIKENLVDGENLIEEFKKLREVTNNYSIPSDTCESYEAVYVMLSELDKAYNN